jgi:signal transduction histidine kinase
MRDRSATFAKGSAASCSQPAADERKPAHATLRDPGYSMNKNSLLGKFALLSLGPIALLGFILGNTLQHQIRARALENAKGGAQVVARLGIQPLLSPADLTNGLSADHLQVLDQALHTKLIGHEVASVRIWGLDSRVIYSDDQSLIGRTFPGNEELDQALHGHVATELFDAARAKQNVDPTTAVFRSYGDLLEVYVPLVFGSDRHPAGAFEIYLPYAPIAASIRHDNLRLYVLLGMGLLLLYALLLPIAYRTGRVLHIQAKRLIGLLSREQETVRRLQDLDRMKSEFISTASHEMRTPLTTIIGFAKSLQQPEFVEDSEMRKEFLGRMERQGDRLLNLVDQLLHTARLEGRETEPKRAPFDFAVLAEEVAAGLDHKGVAIKFDLPDDLPSLVSDRDMVSHILANLLGNAVKYSPPETVCTVGARASGDRFQFWVRDQGIGLSPEQLEHVFEPFWQADSSLTRETGGVGLGLYLVKLLITALKGEISVESEVGKGARFTVMLRSGSQPEDRPEASLEGLRPKPRSLAKT